MQLCILTLTKKIANPDLLEHYSIIKTLLLCASVDSAFKVTIFNISSPNKAMRSALLQFDSYQIISGNYPFAFRKKDRDFTEFAFRMLVLILVFTFQYVKPILMHIFQSSKCLKISMRGYFFLNIN